MPSQPPRLLDTPGQVLAFPLTGTLLIEASAGTGKTYTIANLYLRQVLAGVEVSQLLVVTFTQAATEELRGRIRARLAEALMLLDQAVSLASEPPATKDEFLAALLAWLWPQGEAALTRAQRRLRLGVRAMDEAAIYTIHGFCQRALSEFAFLSGQQLGMEILTDDDDLWRVALQDWWRRTAYPLDQGRARLLNDALRAGNNLRGIEGLRALIRPLLGPQPRRLLPEVPDLAAVLARVDAAAPRIAGLAQVWRDRGEMLRELLRTSKGLSRDKKCLYHADRLEGALAAVEAWFADWAETQELRPPPGGFEALTPAYMAAWPRKSTPDASLKDPFFDACGELWDQILTLRRDLKVAALTDAATSARAQVEAAKEHAQALGYDDLLTRLHAALHQPMPEPGRPDTAEALARALRGRFPVVMIDEFQDTDAIQYGIFRRLYLGQEGLGLVMIGDPKQAIYGFRGGDIFVYARAKTDVGPANIHSLGTNWRSTPGVIQAVNTVFGRRGGDAFVFGEAIPFAPATPAPRPHQALYRDGEAQAALTLWALPRELSSKGEDKALAKDRVRDLTRAALAQEVAALIAEGQAGRARLAAAAELGPQGGGTCPKCRSNSGLGPQDRPLRAQDIAILVRSRHEGAALREALGHWGIRAVSVERTSAFATPEAEALEPLLQAIAEPGDRTLARIALASPLLGLDYARIEADMQGEAAWATWLDTLLALRETWQRRGFMAMFQALFQRIGELADPAAGGMGLSERRLTNLLHLGELLQQASKTQVGMDALLAWYRARRSEAGDNPQDAHQLRLESDADLVQIVTIHGSKGLEYPVVFLPDLWGCKTRDGDGLLAFHRGDEALLDAGSDERDAHLCLAERERLAEDLRLVYVAMTRAKAALYLVWGRAGSGDGRASQTALGWLLHPHQDAVELLTGRPDAFAKVTALQPDLDALAEAGAGSVRVLPIPEPAEARPLPTLTEVQTLSPRRPIRPVPQDWHIASFSELARNVHPGPTPPRDMAATDPALRFPAGSEAGSYLHALLEKIDFRAGVAAQVLDLSARVAARFGLDHDRWGRDAAVWLDRVARTPLNPAGLCLAQIGPAQRLNELELDFAADRVEIRAIDRALQTLWPDPQPPLDAEGFAGMVTGVIDLVFEHGGRYYIADYKSNFLGPDPQDYAQERLASAIRAHRYDLQYLLYTLALHRYLRTRLPGYDYRTHVGGACYLFLRGMRPEHGDRLGVYWAYPDPDLVAHLDTQVFRRPPPELA